MERANGFYWVHFYYIIEKSFRWEIAYYENGMWQCVGDDSQYTDTIFNEIDENQIKR